MFKNMTLDDLNEKIKTYHNISDNSVMLGFLLELEEVVKGDLSFKQIMEGFQSLNVTEE